MSDVNIAKKCLEFKLQIERPCLKYAAKAVSRHVLFSVDIPYPIMKYWFNLTEENNASGATDKADVPSSSISSEPRKYMYTDLLEQAIPAGVFAFRESLSVRKEIHDSLRKNCSSVKSLYKKTSGRQRQALDSKTWRFQIFESYVASFVELKEENKNISEDLVEWKEKFQDLEGELRKLYDEMSKELEKRDEIINDLSCANEELQSYIDILMKSEGLVYNGKNISDVKKKSRTLKCFLSRAKTALWFAESFGLDLGSITVVEKKTGTCHTISVETNTPGATTSAADEERSSGFDKLSEDEKTKVEQILFLLDKFYVGDGFYHEVSMVIDSLPKSYLIKQRRDQLNKLCAISRTPGEFDGCQLDFQETLKECMEVFIAENPEFDFANNSVKIKISGDGAQMTRNTNFTILSVAIIDGNGNPMSAKGNHSVAVVKESEDYEVMRKSFGDAFNSINCLNDTKQIKVGDQTIKLELFFGGDYKFILMVLGLKGATCNNSCVWCKIHKDKRWDMSYDLSYYNSPPLKRTIQEMKEMASKKKDDFCCAHPPLLNIDLDHVILDELHLMLRIIDVLIDNLLEDVLEWDHIDDNSKRRCEERGKHLENLISTIRSCGISFSVWEKTNADGKRSGRYECTSLRGDDKKTLLRLLPDKLRTAIQKDTCDVVIKVWQDFNELYQIITQVNPTEEDIQGCFQKAKNWVKVFLSLADKRKGYTRARVTPYMHAMVYHLPKFLCDYKSVKIYTGQGVERNNDIARSVVLRKSNKWDSTSDVLRLETRQWKLRHHERNKRVYEKSDKDYWDRRILESRQESRKKQKLAN